MASTSHGVRLTCSVSASRFSSTHLRCVGQAAVWHDLQAIRVIHTARPPSDRWTCRHGGHYAGTVYHQEGNTGERNPALTRVGIIHATHGARYEEEDIMLC